jgi:hypothetical protein
VTSNPDWTTNILHIYHRAFAARFGEDRLPQYAIKQRGSRELVTPHKELGCGHYGCVFATNTPGVVFKLTTDHSEAAFVSFILNKAQKIESIFDGLIRYYDIVRLNERYKNREVYAVTREEVKCVGVDNIFFHCIPTASNEDYFFRQKRDLIKFLIDVKKLSHQIMAKCSSFYKKHGVDKLFDEIKLALERYKNMSFDEADHILMNYVKSPRSYKLHTVVAVNLLRIHDLLVNGVNEEFSSNVASTMITLFEDFNILLADVHTGNIGFVDRGDFSGIVIADPGHAVALSPSALEHRIDDLRP